VSGATGGVGDAAQGLGEPVQRATGAGGQAVGGVSPGAGEAVMGTGESAGGAVEGAEQQVGGWSAARARPSTTFCLRA
jgi:hypothetical protein